jgi:hypothetical protein
MKTLAISFFILLFSFCIFHLSNAQGCLPEGITFETQVQIDSFQINYPGCSVIEGDMTINGSDITNLNGLITLNSIGGNLVIGVDYGWDANPALANLTGLDNLASIGCNLTINGNSILINLSGLNSLSAVNGNLSISNNPFLTDISDLGLLNSIGGYLQLGFLGWGGAMGNPLLVSLTGLDGITSLTGLTIVGNLALTDLNGLNNLQSVSGGMVIGGNGALSSLIGLEALTNISGDLQFGYAGFMGWIGNPSLIHLTGLEGLTEIGGTLSFLGSTLVDLEGLNNLSTIGNDLILEDNYNLQDLDGLNNLDSIFGNLMLGPYPGTGGGDWVPGGNPPLLSPSGVENLDYIGGDLVITWNDSLASLSGLENVTAIGGDLFIYANALLNDISGLENIEAGSIGNLEIDHNHSLTVCHIRSVCEYLTAPNGTVEIHDNAPGCNSQEEVEEACLTAVPEVSEFVGRRSSVVSYPNPTSGLTEFLISNFNFQQVNLTVFNAQGQLVATVLDEALPAGEHTITWNTENLPSGIYYYRLTILRASPSGQAADRRLTTGKIVKY